jgi:aminoglycoside phosphotransferase (APT) family kinase protein
VRPSSHGVDLSPADTRLLRGPVPPRALRWAATAVGHGARVREVCALDGGTSSAVHALSIEDVDGRAHELVLRRFVRLDWLAAQPDLAQREATVLELLAENKLPAPRLVAVDHDGSAVDVPAVLMTRLSGHVEWDPTELDPFLRRIAQPLPAIHATALPEGIGLPSYRRHEPILRHPPHWTARPELWQHAIEVLDGRATLGERRFIHRDYHPGNVLWHRAKVTGVVDWVNASIGSPWVDVAHCRVNLASEFGQPAAERFLDLYRECAGNREAYDAHWDIAAAADVATGTASLDEGARDAEDFLANALANL